MRRRGFTLVELLVVVAIVAILAGLLLPALMSAWRSAKVVEAEQRIAVVSQAIVCFAQDRGVEPAGDGLGSRDLVRALGDAGPKRAPYYVALPEELTAAGDLANPVHGADAPAPLNAVHYRRNQGLPPGPRAGQPPVRRGIAFDLWCAGLDPSRPWAVRSP